MVPVYVDLHKKRSPEDSPEMERRNMAEAPPRGIPMESAGDTVEIIGAPNCRFARVGHSDRQAIGALAPHRFRKEPGVRDDEVRVSRHFSSRALETGGPPLAKPWNSHPQWRGNRPRIMDVHWNTTERGPGDSPPPPPPGPWRERSLPPRVHVPTFSTSHWNWKHQPPLPYPPPPPPPPLEEARITHGQVQLSSVRDEHDNRRVFVAISNDETPPQGSNNHQKTEEPEKGSPANITKRNISPPSPEVPPKRLKGLDGLDLLVKASLEMVPMKESSPGCSCPKSKCVALYCECFKAGKRCDPGSCTCVDCKNTVDESGPDGARTLAIRSILARNPRAFSSTSTAPKPTLGPGEVACNCVRSRCLKLYCACFQRGKGCQEGICRCVSCLNTDVSADRQLAIESTLQKRPDAFQTRVKEVGLGCACKNNRCIRKYCECFRNGLKCTDKCSCANCKNQKAVGM